MNHVGFLDLLGEGEAEEATRIGALGDIVNGIEVEREHFLTMHMNIRSIRKHFEELLVLISNKTVSFDLIFLTETWNVGNIGDFNIPEYNCIYNDSQINQNDGVVVYIKNKHTFYYDIVEYCNFKFVILNVDFNGVNIQFNCAYRMPSFNVETYFELLEQHIKKNAYNSHYNTINIFIGDFNIDLLDLQDENTNNYLNIMSKYGYTSYINEPTRVTDSSQTCIDHIFVNNRCKNQNIKMKQFIWQNDTTDHYPIIINIQQDNQVIKQPNNSSKKINYEKLKQLLSSITWHEVTHSLDSNAATNSFIKIIKENVIKASISSKQNRKKRFIKPWITEEVIVSIECRDKMKRRVLRNQGNITLLNEYKKYRNKVNNLIRQTKNTYYKAQINNNKNDIKKIWQVINEATNSVRCKSSNNIVIKDSNDKIIQNNKDKANEFNRYFCSVGQQIASRIKSSTKINNEIAWNVNSLFLYPVNISEVNKHINSLKNTSSVGKDEISIKLIKICYEFIGKPLVHIINLIFETGIVPEQFKETVVSPIYKNGDNTEKHNYRPISLINNLAKIFEKVLKSRLQDFLHKYNIISDNQYGFRPGMSTNMAVYKLTSLINKSLHENHKCIAVFVDLEKAFDTVPHIQLLNKLEAIGIRGRALRVFESYLTDRRQYVKIGTEISTEQIITTGIPQGTIIAPFLFIIYVNDLCSLDIRGQIVSYADDTALIFSGRTWNEAKSMAIENLEKIKLWLDSNMLSCNIKKTKFITFTIYNKYQPDIKELKLNNGDIKIESVEKIKYLGIIIDKNVKWQEHTTYLSNKIRKMLGKFYCLREILPKHMLMQLYKALVESTIRYGIIAWGGTYRNCLDPLPKTQKHILKIIFKKPTRFSSKDLFAESNVLDIRQIYFLEAVLFVRLHSELFEPILHTQNTRAVQNRDIKIETYMKTKQQGFIDYLGPYYYNMIPTDIRNITNVKKFKHAVKEFIGKLSLK